MHLGKSFRKSVGSVLPAVGAAVGAYFGGTQGAGLGYSLGSYGGSMLGADTGSSGSSGGFGSLVNGAVGLGQDYADAELDYYYRKKAADYAFNQNLKMWNLQNAYNDPSAQMARLQAAGLNPNLVYGGGNVTGNAASSGPEYKLDGSVYQNKSIQREQLQLALAEHHQRVTNQSIENDLARQRLELAAREADRSDALAQAQIQAMRANMGVYDANINNMAFNQQHTLRQEAWNKFKHDVDVYDKRVEAYTQRRTKIFGISNRQLYKEIMQEFGRRPMLSDYLNNY